MPFPLSSTGPHQPVTLSGAYASGAGPGVYFVAVRRGGKPEVIGQFTVPAGHQGGTFVKRTLLPPGTYSVGGGGNADGDISVYTATFDATRNAWTLNDVDRLITATLSGTTAIPQTGAVGAVGRR